MNGPAILPWALAAVLATGLTACGGGGGGGSSSGNDGGTTAENQAPTANAGSDIAVHAGETVTLDGTGSSDPDGSVAAYAWSQTGGSLHPTLSEADTATPTFTAPLVDETDNVTFELAVTDDEGTTATDTVTVTIMLPELSVADASVVEGDGGIRQHITFTVTLAGAANGQVNVDYATADGTATAGSYYTAGSDYIAASGTLTFDVAETEKTVTVDVTGDEEIEGSETFTLGLSDVSANAQIAAGTATGTILDEDGELNDTGIVTCSDADSSGLPCDDATAGTDQYPGQDAEHGRDVWANDDRDGHAGFSFTKLDSDGHELPAEAEDWACVRDNVTDLIWEVKTDDGGLRDRNNTYTWYNPDNAANGGSAGTQDGGTCAGGISCDTAGYVAAVTAAGLCGGGGEAVWRMPSQMELQSLVDYSRGSLAIDTDYFPNTIESLYLSASPDSSNTTWAKGVTFSEGRIAIAAKSSLSLVRLVRNGE